MAKASRDKGKRGELEVRDVFRAALAEAWAAAGLEGEPPEIARTPNSGGLHVKGDLSGDGLRGAHVEVKRQERLRLPEWLEQTYDDCPEGHLPVLALRQNKGRGAKANPLGSWHALVPLEWAAKHAAAEMVALLVAESDDPEGA